MIYDKRSKKGLTHRLLSGVLATLMATSVFIGTAVPTFAASTGNTSSVTVTGATGEASLDIGFYPNSVLRIYPVLYDESINKDLGESEQLDKPSVLLGDGNRWEFVGGSGDSADTNYSLYVHFPGHTSTGSSSFQWVPYVDTDTGVPVWKYKQVDVAGKFIPDPAANPSNTDELFTTWLATGLSTGIHIDGQGSGKTFGEIFNDVFYDTTDGLLMTNGVYDKEKGAAFWEQYFSVFLGTYSEGGAMVDDWRQALADNRLSLIVDVNIPVKIPLSDGTKPVGYMNLTNYLQMHETIMKVQGMFTTNPTKEQNYIRQFVPNIGETGASTYAMGCLGNKGCLNKLCEATGHIRFGAGMYTTGIGQEIRPKSAVDAPSQLQDTYAGWGYYHLESELSVPAVQLIEQWQYYDGGVKVHEDEKFRKSYDTLTIFKQSGDADRNADETSRWGGDDFTFNEYSYTITEVDTGTGADKGVLDPPGRPETSEPQITVSTDEMQANKAYKIVVIAKYVKEPPPALDPAPTRVDCQQLVGQIC